MSIASLRETVLRSLSNLTIVACFYPANKSAFNKRLYKRNLLLNRNSNLVKLFLKELIHAFDLFRCPYSVSLKNELQISLYCQLCCTLVSETEENLLVLLVTLTFFANRHEVLQPRGNVCSNTTPSKYIWLSAWSKGNKSHNPSLQVDNLNLSLHELGFLCSSRWAYIT